MERREYLRADITVACQVTGRLRPELSGTVKNLSRGGLLMELRRNGSRVQIPDVGDVLKVDMELPGSQPFGPKCLRAKGVVVRVSHTRDALPMVALQILDMKFESKAEQRPALISTVRGEVRR